MASEDLEIHPHDAPQQPESPRFNTEIDTSAPIQSVKEAAKRFGGIGFWRPVSHKPLHECEAVEVNELEQQLTIRRNETLDILKELESTKNVVEELKSTLRNRASTNAAATCVVLMDLKLDLPQTTGDLAGIRAAIDAYRTRIEKERSDLERTRHRLASTVSKAADLENELKRTEMATELHSFKRAGEAARREVERSMSEIEETKTRIQMAEMKLAAAKKTKASETVFGEQVSIKEVEEAREEVRVRKRALEEALLRVEAANEGKSAAEEALRKWRCRKMTKNEATTTTEQQPVLKAASLSIGQILSRKLLLSEGKKMKSSSRVSLGEMLRKKKKKDVETVKRKKLSFPRITLTVRKRSKKKMWKHNNLCNTI
ncbi:hypothetical protein M569_00801 [Genlisea aurea]|uniref:WEB family protein n=1 Tax=Genlisea aurea TaxID=192259 RepID=S8EDB7_9LAMI|nr:hypothetical protein M569_00801 [Genlisea aurea]